ncbi:MAG: VOC family protein [Candidatus Zixiibacteriota bacterium]
MKKALEAKYKGLVLFVSDIEKSKEFYQRIFGLEVLMDFGESVEFDNGLMLWEKEFAHNFIFGSKCHTKDSAQELEMYFETPDIESDFEILQKSNIDFAHPIRQEPWGQRTIRIYDPDMHLIEIAEPMEVVALRLHREGLKLDEVIEKTQLPKDLVENIIELGDMIYLKWEQIKPDERG